MKLLSRILSLILAVVMLASMIACANNDDTPDENADNTETAEVGSEAETNDPNFVDEVPSNYDGKGKVIKIVGLQKEGVSDELIAEKTNGDAVNDAVFERNKTVEDRLNVKMDVTLVGTVATTLANAVKGGDSTACDVVSNSTHLAMDSVKKGHYVNINHEDSYVDTSKGYWAQGYNDIASFGAGSDEKQYLATGALAISLFRYMFVTIYNKDDFTNKGIDDLYETIINGEWTLEKQESILKDQHKSVTGEDAKMNQNDYYGFITGNCVSVDPYLVSSNIQFIKKNDNGEWEYNGSSETLSRTDTLQETLGRIYNSDNGTYVFKTSAADDTGLTNIADMFTKRQALMATVQLYALETTIINAEFLYGIAPIPKLDAAQTKYGSYVQDQVTSYGVASTVDVTSKDFQTVTAFLEVAAYESYNKVVDAYYNRTLSYKYMQDAESVVILNLIYDSIKFDFAGAFGGVLSYNIRDNFRTVLTNPANKKISSTMAGKEKSMLKSLEKFNKAMNDIKY